NRQSAQRGCPCSAAATHGQIRNRAGGEASHLSFPRRDLRCRSGFRQYRGMAGFHSRGSPPTARSAVLPSAGRERADHLRSIRFGTKPSPGRYRQAGLASPGAAFLQGTEARPLRQPRPGSSLRLAGSQGPSSVAFPASVEREREVLGVDLLVGPVAEKLAQRLVEGLAQLDVLAADAG